MTAAVGAADGPTWTVRVRGPLAGSARHYEALHPRLDGADTRLVAPARPDHRLTDLLRELQALGLEVVDIERHGT